MPEPSARLFGKDGQGDGHELVVTAQLEEIICANEKSDFDWFDSEQD